MPCFDLAVAKTQPMDAVVFDTGKQQTRTLYASPCLRCFCTCAAIFLMFVFSGQLKAQDSPASVWAGTWASAPVQADEKRVLHEETLRQIVHTSIGGSHVRIHISNLFGTQPLRIEDVHIARANRGPSIVPGTDRSLHFDGQPFVVIPAGEAAISDSIGFNVPALTDIAVTMYLPGSVIAPTFHPSAHRTNYIASGDVSSAETMIDPKTAASYYLLTNVDVEDRNAKGAVVTLGASITEGYITTQGANCSWPSVLAERLQQSGQNIAVLNEGIAGNRLLTDGAGAKALSRLERDVLSQPGVRWVIFSDDPINDLGSTRPQPTAAALIDGMQQLIKKAHSKNIKVLCSTLTPYEGANYWTPTGEAAREEVNTFIRSMASGCDAVIDQDAATHDPAHPTRYLSEYDNGDHLHPNDAGHRAIANVIDLSLFSQNLKGAGTPDKSAQHIH